ncbi:MAG: FKBP-type peptidyl-prolyl cis-trans isomerase [Microbacterium sp.]
MRIRRLSALSAAALAVLVLAGCGSAAPESSPTADAGAGLCASVLPDGDVASSVEVTGEIGETPTAEFTMPLELETPERAVAVEGDGAAIAEGDYVSYARTVFDGTTGESLYSEGYDGAGVTQPAVLGGGLDQILGCATEGSRVVLTVPAAEGSPSTVWVIDILGITPEADWCSISEPGDVFPSVAFSAEGVPTVTIPEGDAPDGVQLEVLEEGDGATVEPGDNVTVNYTGVKWSDGTEFDSSWTRGEPATFATTGVVAGFKRALEGQKVGSTVLVSMSPACGYGEAGSSDNALAGETLVFVVDIIEAAKQ